MDNYEWSPSVCHWSHGKDGNGKRGTLDEVMAPEEWDLIGPTEQSNVPAFELDLTIFLKRVAVEITFQKQAKKKIISLSHQGFYKLGRWIYNDNNMKKVCSGPGDNNEP